MVPSKQRVLFLCTGNSCRSQIAEGFLQAMAGDRFAVFSAGSNPTGAVHPLAIRCMAEVGIDVSANRSEHVDAFADQPFDYVITVCDGARARCPRFSGDGRQLHWNFDDPAQATGSEESRLRVFRRVRDEIRHRLRRFLEAHPQPVT